MEQQLEYQNKAFTLSEWADFLEIPLQAFQQRVNQYGFTEAVTMPSPMWDVPQETRIDPGCLSRFRCYSWSHKDGGIYRHQNSTIVYLHREILGITGDQSVMVRFKNQNKFDCRLNNLEIVPMGKQVREAMHPVGCTFKASRQKWEAYITHEKRRYFLGSFEAKNDAIAAYQDACDRINRGLSPKP